VNQPFPRVDGELRAGDKKVSELAAEFGTPLYVYDSRVIADAYQQIATAFDGVDLLMAYSVKANGNLEVLRRLKDLGAGADIVSVGELHRCLRAGLPPERIVFAGVGKTEVEMAAALEVGIMAFNVESEGELRALDAVASRMGKCAPVALRVNPDVLADTPHEYTRTGHSESKFGVPLDRVLDLYRWAAGRPGLEVVGIDVHIGSQILEPSPYEKALDAVLDLAAQLAREEIGLRFVDLGGGFGVRYADEDRMSVEALAEVVVPRVKAAGLRLVLEPGRFIVGEAGLLVTEVLYVKDEGPRTFVVTDAGMTDLIRPSHYQGFHTIEPVQLRDGAHNEVVDVVGPICESGDFLARDRELALPREGDLLAVRTVGAYGFAMASNYNSRPRAAEVVVHGSEVVLARQRETLEDLIRGERLPDGSYGS